MLRDTIALYTELSGNDGEHTPIVIIGAYLDGYDKGREDRTQGEWITWEEAGNDIASPNRHECSCCHDSAQVLVNGIELLSDFCPNCGADMRVKDELNHELNELGGNNESLL